MWPSNYNYILWPKSNALCALQKERAWVWLWEGNEFYISPLVTAPRRVRLGDDEILNGLENCGGEREKSSTVWRIMWRNIEMNCGGDEEEKVFNGSLIF